MKKLIFLMFLITSFNLKSQLLEFNYRSLEKKESQFKISLFKQYLVGVNTLGHVATFSLNSQKGSTAVNFGGMVSSYIGDHYGELIFATNASAGLPRDRFYENQGKKTEGNLYAKINHQFNDLFSAYLDLQYRSISYTAQGTVKGPENIDIDEDYGFFNPKVGVVYNFNPKNKFYLSFARAHREPIRDDFEGGNPEPEELNDFELGWRFTSKKSTFLANLYYMDYTNQLVLTGAINDVGAPLRENVGKSSRLGIELEGNFALSSRWSWQPNITLSNNRNHDFYFERDGKLMDLGNTKISYSPAVVAANIIAFSPTDDWRIVLLTKHVGEQYMGNIDSELSNLKDYTVTDINVNYQIIPQSLFKEINISLLLNNILALKYVSNGYWGHYNDDYSVPGMVKTIEYAGYFPQAQFNFLTGVTLKF